MRTNTTRAAFDWKSLEEHQDVTSELRSKVNILEKELEKNQTSLSQLESKCKELSVKCNKLEVSNVEDEVDMDKDVYVWPEKT